VATTGCEYMTGGVAVILGPTGKGSGAGMSRAASPTSTTLTASLRASPMRVEL